MRTKVSLLVKSTTSIVLHHSWQGERENEHLRQHRFFLFSERESQNANCNRTEDNDEELQNIHTEDIETDAAVAKPDMTNKNDKREKSWFGKKCVKIFRVFTNTFGMTFLAEWGDRLVNLNINTLFQEYIHKGTYYTYCTYPASIDLNETLLSLQIMRQIKIDSFNDRWTNAHTHKHQQFSFQSQHFWVIQSYFEQ